MKKYLSESEIGLNIPAAHDQIFKNGIQHPDLYLWDAWSYVEADILHLYCLAVNRKKEDGSNLLPSERNSFPFHVRHFSSDNNGQTWKDEGCFLKPRLGKGLFDSKTIWSGSVERLTDGSKLIAYTGITEKDSHHNFLQNIAIATSKDGFKVDTISNEPLSSPLRDWTEIRALGYYLDQAKNLGHNDGEAGGPIMAWRDPFIFIDAKNRIHLFWSAKIAALQNAMAHALLKKEGNAFKIEKLYPPIIVPDGAEFTQLELPKIHFDKTTNQYYLIASTCNRLFEGQADDEVDKCVRLYKSSSLNGPWHAWGIDGSVILRSEHLFGLTVLKTEFENNRLLCMAPFTDAAPNHLSLSFAAPFYIDLDPVQVHFK